MTTSDLDTMFWGEKVPVSGRRLRFQITPETASEIAEAVANFKSQMVVTLRSVNCLVAIAADENEDSPSPALISECAWGLSGVADLVHTLDAIERAADRVVHNNSLNEVKRSICGENA